MKKLERKLVKVGDSMGIFIPKECVFLWEVKYGKVPKKVELTIKENGEITIKPAY